MVAIVLVTGVITGAPPAYAVTPTAVDPLVPVEGQHLADGKPPAIDPEAKSDKVPARTFEIGEAFDVVLLPGEVDEPQSSPTPTPTTETTPLPAPDPTIAPTPVITPTPGITPTPSETPEATASAPAAMRAIPDEPAPLGEWIEVGDTRVEVATGAPSNSGMDEVAPSADPVAAVDIEFLAPSAVESAGTALLVIRIQRSDRGEGTGPFSVRVPDTVLQSIAGADADSRVRWVVVPARAAESTSSKASTSSPLVVTSEGDATVLTTRASAGAVTLAALSSPSSADGGGTYTATPISVGSDWDVSAQTGALSWQYPLTVPPAAAGPVPDLSFSYSSQAVDGLTSATNNQSSPVGLGWEIGGGGFIERQYLACNKDDGVGSPHTTSGDLCWREDNATISFGSQSGPLVRDTATGTWKFQNDDGTLVEHATGATKCGTSTGDCWIITATNGTKYYFGRNTLPGSGTVVPTNSRWTVPVFGDDVGEPCYNATFASASCTTPWRWNLDYVVDITGNAMAYYYNAETNYYRRNNTTAVVYTRGGSLNHIDYGFRDGTAYAASSASSKVVFAYDTKGRCIDAITAPANCTTEPVSGIATAPANPAKYTDTPFDLRCPASNACTGKLSPTFWTTAMLKSVTTQVKNPTTYGNVDTWTLVHTFPSPGDGSQAMWLQSITRAGVSGTTITEPPTTFDPVALQNRVNYADDGLSFLDTMRLNVVHLSTGGTISVTYSEQECDESDRTWIISHAPLNEKLCFPQWWSPAVVPAQPEQQDIFHKYVVISYVVDPVTGGAGDSAQETYYDYGTPRWRYNTNRFLPSNRRTWSDFAGFDQVEIREGSSAHPESQRDTVSYFFQGMDGDRADSSGALRDVQISPAGTPPVDDALWFAGSTRYSEVYDSALPTHELVSTTLTTPYASAVTATGAGRKARFVGLGTSTSTEPTSSGGSRTVQSNVTYGAPAPFWKPLTTEELHSDGADSCTSLSYTAPATTPNIVGLVSQSTTLSVKCADAAIATPDAAVATTRFSYDGLGVGAAPTKGLVTKTELVDNYTGGTLSSAHWVTASTATYDTLGRRLTSTDILGRTTSTAYTPTATGPLTKIVDTNALMWTTTTNLEPTHGNVTSVVDANNHTTTITYDVLGRRIGIWYPDRPKASNLQPSVGYAYTLSTTSQNAIATSTVGPLAIITSYELFDGLGRTVQKQAPADGTGTIVTTNFYDGAGRLLGMDSPYWTSSVTPSANLFVPFSPSLVPSWTRGEVDGIDRPLETTLGSFGDVVSTSSTSYEGRDSVTVTPPDGGTPTRTITDSGGHTSSLTQFLASTPSPTADTVVTSYQYDSRGNLVGMTDGAGNDWTWEYDLLNRQTQAVDPDTGTTTKVYDIAGRLLSSTDARGVTLSRTYDNLDRPTAVYSGPAPSGAIQISYLYDTLAKGQLTSSTSYVGSTAGTAGAPYTTTVTGYDAANRPLGSTLSIPTSAPAFGGQTITSTVQYNTAGLVSKAILPAVGGLPAETVNYGYDTLGLPSTLSTTGIVVSASQNALGQLSLLDRTGTHRVTSAFGYNAATGAIDVIEHRYRNGTTVNTVLAATAFDRDLAGTITSLTTTSDTVATDTQCFGHDHLGAMVEAWTPSSGDCTDAQSATELGGPAPYWQSYEIDPLTGNRVAITRHGLNNDPTVTDAYDYPDPGAAHPHAVTSIVRDDGSTTSTDAYQYDDIGSTTLRADQEFTYDEFGRIATITDSAGDMQTRIYDASGSLLMQSDPVEGTTLFAGDILTWAPGATAASGSRSYRLAGFSVAERNSEAGVAGTAVTWVCTNDQSTPLVEVSAADGSVTSRYQDPFGASRGATVAWSSVRSFLGLPNSDFADLVQLGARAYDTALGRFMTVDPVLSPSEPQQNSGYGYGWNRPVTSADPSGMRIDEQGGSPQKPTGKPPTSNGGINPPPAPGTIAAYPTNGNLGDALMWNLALEGQILGGLAESLWDATYLQQYADMIAFACDPPGFINARIEDSNQQQALIQAFIADPGATWDAISKPIIDDMTNNPGHAIGFTTGTIASFALPGGAALKGLRGAKSAQSAAGGAASVRIGQAGEAAVQAAYKIGPKATAVVDGRTRIFDGLNATSVSEVKNVSYQAFTQQLHDTVAYAQKHNLRFDLYVRPGPAGIGTTLSGPLRNAVANGDINLRFIP